MSCWKKWSSIISNGQWIDWEDIYYSHEIDALSSINSKVDTLTKRLDKMGIQGYTSSLAVNCEICGGGYETTECQVGRSFASS